MSNQKLRAIYKQLNDKIEDAKEAALFEVKELKDDLNELQRHYSGRKKETDIQPDDILRSAYEIAHRMREIQKRREILAEMEDTAAETEALAYLESRGAKFLTRPVGWHFQTAKERFLLHEKDAVQAAAELRKLLAAGKRLKKPKKRKPVPTPVDKKSVEKPAKEAAPTQEATAKKPVKAKKAEDPAKAPAKPKAKSAPKVEPEKSAKPKKEAKVAKGKTAAKPKTAAKAKSEAKEAKPKNAAKPKKAEKPKAAAKTTKKGKSADKPKAESGGKAKKAAKPKSKKK